ncbi:kinase-like protein [Leucogyrophana mollusca]|uniref:Kinase-like protein n=1 Tax=Leucogyrophana mollusca TaxID=85980 RepID=A0ACB8BX68_9AGAM|nr:kinase-like protein [Leucogyrophana mollusca]
MQFASAPWVAPAQAVLAGIDDLCARASSNRNALSQLRDRCHELIVVLEQRYANTPDIEQRNAVASVKSTLETIAQRTGRRKDISVAAQFLRLDDMRADVRQSHLDITVCLSNIRISRPFHSVAKKSVPQVDIHVWEEGFESSSKRDRDEGLQYLSDIQNSKDLIFAAQGERKEDLVGFMSMMQKCLPHVSRTSHRSRGLETNLYRIQKATQTLLPEMHLEHGEVRRIGQLPVGRIGSMDLYEGLYLGEEKVTIKLFHKVEANSTSLLRFQREVAIWKRVWDVDHGAHVLPFYGFCQNDGKFPYVITPSHSNGDAINYIRKYPDLDHGNLICDIAEGVSALHSMVPPVIHGNLRGASVIVDLSGRPFITDFGLFMLEEDITGDHFTQSVGESNGHRWLAPELLFENARMTTSSDVYAYAMTVLEFMTLAQPWATVRSTTQLIIRVSNGERPERPKGPVGEAAHSRGLDDHLWGLMQRCWAQNPSERPRIGDILSDLSLRKTLRVASIDEKRVNHVGEPTKANTERPQRLSTSGAR